MRTEQIVGCSGLRGRLPPDLLGDPGEVVTPPSLSSLIPNQREQLRQNNNYLFCLVK